MPGAPLPYTTDTVEEYTGEQLALSTSQRVHATLRGSTLTGGRARNGAQIFLNVPYALPVPRWTDAKPLPQDFQYEEREYTEDGLYCAQPQREYSNKSIRERCGLGQATDCPFFADIYLPSHVDLTSPKTAALPVKVFIHGGFLQFGSTSGYHYNQQQYCAQTRNEIRVLLGHRISIFGFMAAETPNLDGNYGFKDCWLGLEWVRDNIAAFGGDPSQIHLSGLSGGGHVVAELLHQAARRAPAPAPFCTATLYSNAILSNPANLSSAQKQFEAICRLVQLDPTSPSALEDLRAVSTKQLVSAVERAGKLSTFRGVYGKDGWMSELIDFQKSPAFADGLRKAGVRSVLVGEVRDEHEFYKIVHPATSVDELPANLGRYYPSSDARKLLATYPQLPSNATGTQIDTLFGRILSDGQVYIPVRQLARDLLAQNYPCVRFEISYLVESWKKQNPYVLHGTDLCLHHCRLSTLTPKEVGVALNLLNTLDLERIAAEKGRRHPVDQMLRLQEDGEIQWIHDERYAPLMLKEAAVRA